MMDMQISIFYISLLKEFEVMRKGIKKVLFKVKLKDVQVLRERFPRKSRNYFWTDGLSPSHLSTFSLVFIAFTICAIDLISRE
jgi:hypothetical protein